MLTEIQLRDFRCFPFLRFAPEAGLNFVVGANAQGKTSLLEAICVLLRLQSPRASALAEVIRFGEPGFGLDGHFHGRHLHVKFTGSEKRYVLDSKPQTRMADYLAVGRAVWISNDDMQLVRGTGAARRRYLDFAAAQMEAGYLRSLRAYERALRSRNVLLREGRPRREIDAFDGPLIESGAAVQAARETLVRSLAPLVGQACGEITGGREILAMTWTPGNALPLAEALTASREEETRLQTTVVGPHRDDVLLALEERPAATFASEGQQRGIALALKIGQARHIEHGTGTAPLFLLDDIFGELDPGRRANLMRSLPADSQIIATATSLRWMPQDLSAARFELSGKILDRRA